MTEWIRTKNICEVYAIGNRNLVVAMVRVYNYNVKMQGQFFKCIISDYIVEYVNNNSLALTRFSVVRIKGRVRAKSIFSSVTVR